MDRKNEKLVSALDYKGVVFELVECPDVIWVGCVDYAGNNSDESDIDATYKRYSEKLADVAKQELINPDNSAALSINYGSEDKPCGIMFAQETHSREQDERYDIFFQPGSLWLRVCDSKTAAALLGKEDPGLYEYFGLLSEVAEANGYRQNPDINIEIEYRCNKTNSAYAYVPVIKSAA